MNTKTVNQVREVSAIREELARLRKEDQNGMSDIGRAKIQSAIAFLSWVLCEPPYDEDKVAWGESRDVPSMGREYLKGHPNLADMASVHISVWRELLERAGVSSGDTEGYYLHELQALNDIEKACEIEKGRALDGA